MKKLSLILCIALLVNLFTIVYASNCSHDYTIKDASNYSPEYESLDDTSHIVEEFYDKICESCGEIVERKVPEEPWEAEHNIIDGVCEECGYGGSLDNNYYEDNEYSDDYDDNYYAEPEYPASDEIQVFLNGEKIEFDVDPQIINGRTMVPVRAIFEALGADVLWDNITQKVTAYLKREYVYFDYVELKIDSTEMYSSNGKYHLDSPAIVKEGRTLIPLRACAEAFNLKVDWDDYSKTVTIYETVTVETENLDSDGSWIHQTYDEKGNLTHREYSDGSWQKYTYDEYGNETSEEYYDGDDVEYTQYNNSYDHRGNLTMYQTDEFWEKYTYDNNNCLIYHEDSDGEWCKYFYDEYRNHIRTEHDNGDVEIKEYDLHRNITLRRYIYGSGGSERWTKYNYDGEGKLISCEDSDGTKETYQYDKNGNKIYYEAKGGFAGQYWIKYSYDSDNNLVCEELIGGDKNYYTTIIKK